MPFDIVHLIFKNCRPKDAACLGLTCPKFYVYFKTDYPAPVPLSASVCDCDPAAARVCTKHNFGENLGRSLMSWKGFKGYRHIPHPVHRFANQAVYGRVKSGQWTRMEEALMSRYADYRLSLEAKNQSHRLSTLDIKNLMQPLPNPHNMGLNWYRAAFNVIEQSFYNLHSISNVDYSDWMRCQFAQYHLRAYWKKFRVFEDNGSYFTLLSYYSAYTESEKLKSWAITPEAIALHKEERLGNILDKSP